jgi:hypothetical protein
MFPEVQTLPEPGHMLRATDLSYKQTPSIPLQYALLAFSCLIDEVRVLKSTCLHGLLPTPDTA